MIKKKILHHFFAWWFLTVAIVSCSPYMSPASPHGATQADHPLATAAQENIKNEFTDGCIPPQFSFDYPSVAWDGSPEPQFVPPPVNWVIQTSLPEQANFSYLQFIERHSDYDVIWIESGNYFFLFRSDTQTWNKMLIPTDPRDSQYPGANFFTGLRLFQDNNGIVWALGYYYRNDVISSPYMRFLRLNDHQRFDTVGDPVAGYSQIATESVGDAFWFIESSETNTYLSRFDPATAVTNRILTREIGELGSSIAVDAVGNIFILRPKERDLLEYSPKSNTTKKNVAYDKLRETDFDREVFLFFDSLGNLWIGDYAWINFEHQDYEGNPIWHQIFRSPLFIYKVEGDSFYRWNRPIPSAETSDGRIWFNGDMAGLVWLDPKSGQWCKFTTIRSNILEDSDGSLWLLYDDNLYKYDITAP